MSKAKPRYDVSFWNLDYLETVLLQDVGEHIGELKPFYPPLPNVADRVSLLESGEIIRYHHKDRVLEISRPGSAQSFELLKLTAKETLIDLVVVQEHARPLCPSLPAST